MGCSSSSFAGSPDGFHAAFSLEERLGRGAYGQVWSCTDVASDERLAVKILRLWRGPESLGKVGCFRRQLTSREVTAKAQTEADLWKRIGRHEHCVELFQVFMEKMICYLVMEHCDRSVVKALQEVWPCPVEEDVLRIIYHTLLALSHVHSCGIVHRDVKPENILLGGADGTVTKLCDFGLAVATSSDRRVLQEVAGTPPYMAPEMVRGDPQTHKIDMWSLGVTAYVMLYGRFPYAPVVPGNMQSIKEAIARGIPPPRYQAKPDMPAPSRLAERAARILLVRSPEAREEAQGVLALPVGKRLKEAASNSPDVVRRSATPKNSFLKVVQAAQREIDCFLIPSNDDGTLDRELAHQRLRSKARRFSAPSSFAQDDRRKTTRTWRRWSTGAPDRHLAARRSFGVSLGIRRSSAPGVRAELRSPPPIRWSFLSASSRSSFASVTPASNSPPADVAEAREGGLGLSDFAPRLLGRGPCSAATQDFPPATPKLD